MPIKKKQPQLMKHSVHLSCKIFQDKNQEDQKKPCASRSSNGLVINHLIAIMIL